MREDQIKKIERYEVKTFPVPFPIGEHQENITIITNTPATKPSKEQIINQAFKFHSKGNIPEAFKYYQYFINQGFTAPRVFSNYGVILKDLGNLKEAELYTRKAIQLNPNFADAHYNLGNILRDLGKFQEAESSTRKAIVIKPDFAEAHCNLGIILKDLGKLKEAELSQRKAIEINPHFAEAHCNLGIVLKDLGKFQEAELSQLKAIELNHDFAMAYFSLSNLQYSNKNKKWKDQLFSENILKNNSKKNQVDIYFARANILHKEKNYEKSSRYLKLANKLQLDIKPSMPERILKKSKVLLIESNKKEINQKEPKKYPESIFIVGMHRSGTTLVESIISMNEDVYALGDITILEKSYVESKELNQGINLSELYFRKVINLINELKVTTNKCTYNYQFTGIIASQIPNSKIIHCFRNPLDNILSLYRTSFSTGQEYFSSIVDCAKVYIDQEEIMKEYKNRFRSQIYDLNYDFLVRNPKQEIKYLISWLGWEWNESYLKPHLNPRSVSTGSSVQVRSPINSKSIDGWKNYKEILKPAIEILNQSDKYRDLIH